MCQSLACQVIGFWEVNDQDGSEFTDKWAIRSWSLLGGSDWVGTCLWKVYPCSWTLPLSASWLPLTKQLFHHTLFTMMFSSLFFFFLWGAVLKIELRAACLLGKCSTHHDVLPYLRLKKMESGDHELKPLNLSSSKLFLSGICHSERKSD
jgi:hypothetical protein